MWRERGAVGPGCNCLAPRLQRDSVWAMYGARVDVVVCRQKTSSFVKIATEPMRQYTTTG